MSEDSSDDDSSSEEADVSLGHNDAGMLANFFEWAYCSVRGERDTNEDTQIVKLLKKSDVALVGVFDGHGGHKCSSFCAKRLPSLLDEKPDQSDDAIKNAFKDLDVEYLEECEDDGSCACALLLFRDSQSEFVVANLGDSRALLLPSSSAEIRVLTTDHKPDVAEERARIEATGATVSIQRIVQHGKRVNVPRIDGQLATSRAIGDDSMKDDDTEPENMAISPVPDVTRGTWAPQDLLVVACDGLWDVCSNEDVASLIRSQRAAGKSLADVAQALCDVALANKSDDNITVVLALRTGEKRPGSSAAKPAQPIESDAPQKQVAVAEESEPEPEPEPEPEIRMAQKVEGAGSSSKGKEEEAEEEAEEAPTSIIIPDIGVVPRFSQDSTIVIRRYQREDAAQCSFCMACAWVSNAELHRLVDPAFAPGFVEYVKSRCDDFTLDRVTPLLMEKPKSCIFVAEIDGVVCGCVAIEYNPILKDPPFIARPNAEVTRMAVHPAVSGHGIAGALLDACKWHCKSNAIKTLFLDTGSFMGPAVQFYKKQGLVMLAAITTKVETESCPDTMVQVYRFVLPIKQKKSKQKKKIKQKLDKMERKIAEARKKRRQLEKQLRKLKK